MKIHPFLSRTTACIHRKIVFHSNIVYDLEFYFRTVCMMKEWVETDLISVLKMNSSISQQNRLLITKSNTIPCKTLFLTVNTISITNEKSWQNKDTKQRSECRNSASLLLIWQCSSTISLSIQKSSKEPCWMPSSLNDLLSFLIFLSSKYIHCKYVGME